MEPVQSPIYHNDNDPVNRNGMRLAFVLQAEAIWFSEENREH